MATTQTEERPGTRAVLRHGRFSASKARLVLNLIRGTSIDDARGVLGQLDRGAAEPIRKLLESAVANAAHNDGLPADELYISACYADEGPTMKRFRPRARGRGSRIFKRTCHITIVVSRYRPEELERLRGREERSGRAKPDAAAQRRRRVARSRGEAEAGTTDEVATDEVASDEVTTDEVGSTDEVAADSPAASEDESNGGAPAIQGFAGSGGDSAEDGDASAPFGAGSHDALDDGSQPDGFPIKGNKDSMLYHPPDTRFYDRTVAEVWFATAEDAERAGFTLPPSLANETGAGDGEEN